VAAVVEVGAGVVEDAVVGAGVVLEGVVLDAALVVAAAVCVVEAGTPEVAL
jgi:hypothetical protein